MKFVILGILVFVFYKMVFKPKRIDPGPIQPPIQEKEDTGFVDYEEVE